MTSEEQQALMKHMGLIWTAVKRTPASVFSYLEKRDLVHLLVPRFLRLLRNYKEGKAGFPHWIISNLRREINRLVNRRLIVSKLDTLQWGEKDDLNTTDRADRITPEVRECLDLALSNLSSVNREIVCRFYGMEEHEAQFCHQIAADMQLSVQDVKTRLIRVRQALASDGRMIAAYRELGRVAS